MAMRRLYRIRKGLDPLYQIRVRGRTLFQMGARFCGARWAPFQFCQTEQMAMYCYISVC